MNDLQRITLQRGLRLLGNRNADPWHDSVNKKLHALMLYAIRTRTDSTDLIEVRFTAINLALYHDNG